MSRTFSNIPEPRYVEKANSMSKFEISASDFTDNQILITQAKFEEILRHDIISIKNDDDSHYLYYKYVDNSGLSIYYNVLTNIELQVMPSKILMTNNTSSQLEEINSELDNLT